MSKLSDELGAVFGWLFWIGLIGLMFVPMVTSDDDSGSSAISANTGESSAYPESDSNIDYDPSQ